MTSKERNWEPEIGDYKGLIDIVRSRRMVYDYTSDEVPEEDIEKILEAARWAPSGHNSQPWEFIVVRDTELLDNIAYILDKQRKWISTLDEDFPAHGRSYLDDISVMIVVVGDLRKRSYFPSVSTYGPRESSVTNGIYYESIGCCMQNIHLAAKSLGLGTVHLSVRERFQEELRKALEIPSPMVIHNVVPVGVPAQPSPGQNVSRQGLHENLHYETFDENKVLDDDLFATELHDPEQRTRLMHGEPN